MKISILSSETAENLTVYCMRQILGLLLVNDNGSTAKYIHKHHLVWCFDYVFELLFPQWLSLSLYLFTSKDK